MKTFKYYSQYQKHEILKINLTKFVQDLYPENYKSLLKERRPK